MDQEDADIMHAILSKLPKPLDLDHLLTRSFSLHAAHPPASLPRHIWAPIDADSVLKSAADPARVAVQSLEEGQAAFHRQAARLRRQKLLLQAKAWAWRNRRPVASLAFAMTVAVAAYLVQRHNLSLRIPGIWSR